MTLRTGFHKKFKFAVEEFGFTVATFQKVSALEAEAAKVEYREGGTLIADKSPGLVSFSDITLERGVVLDFDMYNWFLDVVNAAADVGQIDPIIRRTLDIVQLDRLNIELRRWRVVNAWPMKYVAGEWDNEADENVIESVTLTYDYFDRV